MQTRMPLTEVPELVVGNRLIIQKIWLRNPVYGIRGLPASAAEYNRRMSLPTLAESVHTYFSKRRDYVTGYAGQSARLLQGYGLWTSTFLDGTKKVLNIPENLVCRKGVWIAEGGTTSPVELPPLGWALEYDKPTGFPSRTEPKREVAERFVDDEPSYFNYRNEGLKSVFHRRTKNMGPFYINACNSPDSFLWEIGGRMCYRNERHVKSGKPEIYLLDVGEDAEFVKTLGFAGFFEPIDFDLLDATFLGEKDYRSKEFVLVNKGVVGNLEDPTTSSGMINAHLQRHGFSFSVEYPRGFMRHIDEYIPDVIIYTGKVDIPKLLMLTMLNNETVH